MQVRLKREPAVIAIDTREQESLYDASTGEEYLGDRSKLERSACGKFYAGPGDLRLVAVPRGAFTFGDIATVRKTLIVGDYALAGHEAKLSIERKKIGDFVHWATVEHDGRCALELVRARAHGIKLVILVECSIDDILQKRYLNPLYLWRCAVSGKSAVHPNAALGAAWRFTKDGFPVIFAGNAAAARLTAEQMLLQTAEDVHQERRAALAVQAMRN